MLSKSFLLFLIVGAFSSTAIINFVSRYEDQAEIDPYRYDIETEKELLKWYLETNKELLSDKTLKRNQNLKGSNTSPQLFDQYITSLDWDQWSINFGNKPSLNDARMQVPFFDSWDIDEKNPKAVATIEELVLFREFLTKVWIKSYHRNALKNERPSPYIGQSAEDDIEYLWPSRELGEEGGVFLSIFPKGMQFLKITKDLEDYFKNFSLADYQKLKSEVRGVKFPGYKVFKYQLNELIDGAHRFLIGFVMHELYHAFQFHTVPVRNLVNPHDNNGQIIKGLFKDFGKDFSDKTIGEAGGVDAYLAKSLPVARKQVQVMRKLLRTDRNTKARKQALKQLKTVFPMTRIANISSYNTLNKENLWQKIARNVIQKKSLYWDSFIKSEIYEEIEGFGLNRVLLKGHEANIRDFAFFVQYLRTEEITADEDNMGLEFERVKEFGNTALGAFAKWMAHSDGFREKFTGVAGNHMSVSPKAPYNLLRWTPDLKADVGGNDAVGYYLVWDAYMAWQGTKLEPPVSDMLRGHWMPILINQRLVEIEREVLSGKKCDTFKTELNDLVARNVRLLTPGEKVQKKLRNAYPEFLSQFKENFKRFSGVVKSLKRNNCYIN